MQLYCCGTSVCRSMQINLSTVKWETSETIEYLIDLETSLLDGQLIVPMNASYKNCTILYIAALSLTNYLCFKNCCPFLSH